MSWHIYDATVASRQEDGTIAVHLVGADMEPLSISGTVLMAERLTTIVVHSTVTDSGKPLFTPRNDVLYLDPESGKAAYDPSVLVPGLEAEEPSLVGV